MQTQRSWVQIPHGAEGNGGGECAEAGNFGVGVVDGGGVDVGVRVVDGSFGVGGKEWCAFWYCIIWWNFLMYSSKKNWSS